MRMRSSLSGWDIAYCGWDLMVRASDCQCTSGNGPGFDPSIRRHSGIWRAADEAVLNKVRKKIFKKSPQKIFKKKINISWKYLCISSNIRKSFLIFDFAPDPIWFLFYQCGTYFTILYYSHLYRFILPLACFWQFNRRQNRLNQPSSSSTEILQCFYGVVITKSLFYCSSLGLIITLIVVALWWPIFCLSCITTFLIQFCGSCVVIPSRSSLSLDLVALLPTPSPDWLLRASRVLWLEPCSTPSSWKKS